MKPSSGASLIFCVVCKMLLITLKMPPSLKMPPFLFFLGFFSVSKEGAALMGDTAIQNIYCYLIYIYEICNIAMSTRLLNSISSRICRQNTQFNMYTTTSKHQEGCTFKDSHPTCFITTNFDKFHRESFARGGESR